MEFSILFSNESSKSSRLNSFDEGMEFGFQNLNQGREWIPLAFYSFKCTQRDSNIIVGSDLMPGNNFINIRGYNVSYSLVGATIAHRAELKLCGNEIMQNNASLSFRWLQMVISGRSDNADPAYLDNITISINFPEEHSMTLFDDDFNSEMMIK